MLEFVHCHCVRCLMDVGVGDNDSSCSGDCRFNGRVPGTSTSTPVVVRRDSAPVHLATVNRSSMLPVLEYCR